MLTSRLQSSLTELATQHLLRSRTTITERTDKHVLVDGNLLLNFCSNDYLNLSTHPDVIAAFIQGVQAFGLGSGSSPAISGYSAAHQQLEEAAAEFLQRDRAMLFNSGYHANLGVLTTFANRHTSIIADKLCHASLIDGITLSRAKHLRYHHNDIMHAELLLKKNSCEKLVVSESVFSMEGDIADVRSLSTLALKQQAMLIVDDAHGIGVLGQHGRGICEHLQLSSHDVPCLVSPLGKSPGSMGAIVSGSSDVIDMLLQSARTYRYSTAIPAAICTATLAALKILSSDNERREKLRALSAFFLRETSRRGLALTSFDTTPIKSILIGSNQATFALQQKLIERGLFVSCIRPPTVPVNKARIRISLNCAHTEMDILHLLDALAEAYEQLR